MFLVIGRTFKEAWNNFIRNGWLSVAAIIVLFLSLYVISLLYVVSLAANSVLQDYQDKVSISVYFKIDVAEPDIIIAQHEIDSYPEVKSTEYISRDQALENFKRNNANEPTIIKSLEEIGDNPLQASVIVKAKNPGQYEAIVGRLGDDASIKNNVSRVNYEKNKELIDKFSNNVYDTKKLWLSLAILFTIISIIITFNTIRITIYTHKNEIEVMRLVGASNTFIRLPFVFEGMIYAISALILSMLVLFITLKFAAPQISRNIMPEEFMKIYLSKFALLVGVQLLAGIFLGVVSSMIAIRKYLKI